MKKVIEKLKALENNPRLANRIYKAVTFAAAAISIALILAMALAGPDARISPPAGGSREGAVPDGKNEITDNASDGRTTDYAADRGIVEPLSPDASDSPTSPEPASLTLTITDSEAAGLMAISLKDKLPIDNLSVFFTSPDIITIGGKIKKSDIGAFIGNKELPLLKAALILAPDTLDLSLAFSLVLDDGGHLAASPVKAVVNGINITRLIPQSAVDWANESLYSLLPDEVELHSLSIGDGSITFTIRA